MQNLFERLLVTLNALASLTVVALMLLIVGDVLGRRLFDSPIAGVPEIVKVAIVGMVWLQFAHTLRSGRHLRSNLIFGSLPTVGKRIIYALNCAAGVTVFALIVWYAHDDVLKTFSAGIFEGEHPVRIPVWPIWSLVVLGAALMTVEYFIQLVDVVFRGRLPEGEQETTASEPAASDTNSAQ